MQKVAWMLLGPTAAGKTEKAIRLAQNLPCEIISVDSSMVYRGLNIGSGKPHRDILDKTQHYLVNIRDPACNYSLGEFCKDALLVMEDIYLRGKIPLLVGGTMLYFNALIHGLSELPKADLKIRHAIEELSKNHGWDYLHRELQLIDPIAASKIKPTDAQRIERALEVYYITGQPISSWQQQRVNFLQDWQLKICVMAPASKDLLHDIITARFDHMLETGLISEVKALLETVPQDVPALKAVGYRQICEYLAKQVDYAEMRHRAIIATRQLAKRQYTWLRKFNNLFNQLAWFDSFDAALLERLAHFFIAGEQADVCLKLLI